MKTYFEIIHFMEDCFDFCEVPYERNECWDGFQLRFPWSVGDVAINSYTYGASCGRVETFHFPWDDGDVTSMTPMEAVYKIVTYYRKKEA